MREVEHGEGVWRVRKFKLWHTDIEDGFSAIKAEPIVNIRGKIGAVFICYDMVTIGRDNKLFAMGKVLQKYKPEILFLPANWEFNFELVENIIKTSIKDITSLKVALFSCTNTELIIATNNEIKKINEYSWIGNNLDQLQYYKLKSWFLD